MNRRIKWSPKVAQAPIARLYERDAAGIRDDELLDQVGFALWARASDVALLARSGVRCPIDGTEFGLGDGVWYRVPRDATGTCPACGWQTTVAAWHDSFRKQDLSGMAPFIAVYVASWPTARSYRDRMLLVDRLLHEVHSTGGNLARTLIEGGRRNSPHAFLDRLAFGSASTVDHEARETFSRTPLNRSRRANDCVRARVALSAAFARRDWSEVATLVADDVVSDGRRKALTERSVGREAWLRRIAASVQFDPEDMSVALAELDKRYTAQSLYRGE